LNRKPQQTNTLLRLRSIAVSCNETEARPFGVPFSFLKTAPPGGAECFESRTPATRQRRPLWGFHLTITDDLHDRAQRAAKNQALFREINERVKELNTGFGAILPMGDWVCECSNDTCVERVKMLMEEYEAVRKDGARFCVTPDDAHVWHDVETVVERNERYWVVEKAGLAARLTEDANPRSPKGPLRLRT
jgi:hypothetical protein